MKTKRTKDNFLQAKLGRKESIDAKELELIAGGRIKALIPPQSVQGRKENVICYNVAPYTTLKFFITCIQSKEQFVDTVRRCIGLLLEMRGLYLSPGRLLTDFERIFVTLSDKTLHFIYLPIMSYDAKFSESRFFSDILEATPCSTHDFLILAEQMRGFFSRPVPFSLSEFSEFINSASEGPVEREIRQRELLKGEGAQASRYMDDIGAAPHENSSQTVLLPTTAVASAARLTRLRTGQSIAINKDCLKIGTEAGRVDWLITDNAGISRQHASIICRDGKYYFIDNESLNKSFVNDADAPPLVELALENGCTIRLADEDFSFSLPDGE